MKLSTSQIERVKVSGISLGLIMILRYFAQIMLEKNTLFSQWNAGHIDHLFDSAHNSAGRIYPNPQRIFLLCYVTQGTLQVFAIFLLLLL